MPQLVDEFNGDQAGAAPRFVTVLDRGLLVSESVSGLLPRLQKLTADLNGIAQMVAASGPIGGRTLFEEVRRAQPGEKLTADQGRIRRSVNWEWEDVTPTTRDASTLLDAIVADVEAKVSSQHVVSMLSGGWDSRMLLALTDRNPTATCVRALTTSSDTGTIMEELVAAQVAQKLSISHEIVMPHRNCFGEDLAIFAEAVDFQTSFHVWLVPLVRRLAEIYPDPQEAIVLDGLGGGLFVGGAFADPPGRGALMDKRLAGATRYLDGAERILKTAVIANFREAIQADASEIIRRHLDHPHGHVLSAYLTRTLPGISLAPHGLVRQAARIATPFVSDRVVKAGLSLPPEDHAGDRLYPLLMEKIHPTLATLATAQAQVPWPRPHPRRITSIEAIRHLRSLILVDPLRELLTAELQEAGPNYWRKILSTTGGQHLLRGLATLSLWWRDYQDEVVGFNVETWLR